MNKVRFTINALAVFGFTLAFTSLAQAQATRTWVSGTGDDAFPCSRTSPCKTFAGAISNTAVGGEIDALDPGGFGAVTITKSITLDGGTGSGWASILVSQTNAINVVLSSAGVVRLRHLNLTGITGQGLNGINILSSTASGTSVIVNDALIDGFSQNGINATFGNTGILIVENSTIQDSAKGIFVSATAGFGAASVRSTRLQQLGTGMELSTNGFATVDGCNATFNAGDAFKTSATGNQMNVSNSVMAHNGGAGANASVAGSTIRVALNQVYNNGSSFLIAGGATVASDGQNRVAANAGGVAPNGAITLQ